LGGKKKEFFIEQIMDDLLETYVKKVLGGKAWSVDIVLLVGAELAQIVNKMPGKKGSEKAELVCQTILKMLDGAVKVETEREGESTEKEKTIAQLEECKKIVTTLLPVTLTLLVAASRGKIALQKVKTEGCFAGLLHCFSGQAVAPSGPQTPEQPKKDPQVVENKSQGGLELRQVVLQSHESPLPSSPENKL
jgi:hypothetical protein